MQEVLERKRRKQDIPYESDEDWVVAHMQPSNRAGLPAGAVARADTRRSVH